MPPDAARCHQMPPDAASALVSRIVSFFWLLSAHAHRYKIDSSFSALVSFSQKQADRQADRQTDRQTDRNTDRLTSRQAGRD